MATGIQLDFVKLPADQHITVAIGPANAFADLQNPTAAELNALQPASQSISWNDYDFGIQASEQTSDPSLADVSTYQDFGASAYGGGISFYYPKEYDDPSNPHSVLYDLTDKPHELVVIAVRIDGATKTSAPFADGDLVSIYLAMTDGETNSLAGADALRRTVNFIQQSVFAYYTVVGPRTVVPRVTTLAVAPGVSKRITATLGGREFTNGLRWRSSDPTKATVSPAGVVTGVAAGSATISVSDPNSTAAAATIEITV